MLATAKWPDVEAGPRRRRRISRADGSQEGAFGKIL
jgi:hypothetical protein